jgi:3-oxoacyl-[acyl-carrier-protein] synthase-1
MPAVIGASSVLCAGGRGTEQLWATVRSGIACIKNSYVMDRHFDPIQMGLVPEDALAPLPEELESEPLPSSARRMLRLAGPTLAAVVEAAGAGAQFGQTPPGPDTGPGPVTVYLGLPQLNAADAPWLDKFLQYLGTCAAVPTDADSSQIFPAGRAAALLALEAAVIHLSQNPTATVVVGGVDTFLDLRRIAALDSEARILGPRVMDGFIPGEGAAFFVLKDASAIQAGSAAGTVHVKGVATVADEGHRYGSAPALGEGVSNALEKLRGALHGGEQPVASTFAAFNGENFEAKLWGVARLRHSDFFAPTMVIQHPADSIGDTGAASGAILTALAAFAMSRGQRESSALVWAASDHETRGCALLSS